MARLREESRAIVGCPEEELKVECQGLSSIWKVSCRGHVFQCSFRSGEAEMRAFIDGSWHSVTFNGPAAYSCATELEQKKIDPS